MKAEKINIDDIFSIPLEYRIPIYQRKYSWKEEQVEELLEDILRVGSGNAYDHFIGSYVYLEQGKAKRSALKTRTIIDGQQRITTLTLIFLVISEIAKNNPECDIDYNYVLNNYVINNSETDFRYKLTLTEEDNNTLHKIISSIELGKEINFEESDSTRIKENYEIIKNIININNLETYLDGIDKLSIVAISLDNNYDDPQLIFESLNSTGSVLNNNDLIRNYILMGSNPKEQDTLYLGYWKDIEKGFKDNDDEFERFIRDYLTIKNEGTIPNENNTYKEFKQYAIQNDNDIQDLVKDISYYSKFYFNLINGEESDLKLKSKIDSLENFKFRVTRPFLLNVYKDYYEGVITVDEFIRIIELVESYVVRRHICGYETRSHNKTFAKLYYKIDKENYLKSFELAIALYEDYQEFPTDEELSEKLRTINAYKLRQSKKILIKLENENETEKILNTDKITIEHILPKNPNLSEEWQEALGENWSEIQEKYVNTIGNLTLTGHNSELGDKPFLTKKNMKNGYIESKFKLSKDLLDLEVWNQDTIEKRTEKLTKEIIRIWKYPKIDGDIIQKRIENKMKKATKISNTEKLQEAYWTTLKQLIKNKGYATRKPGKSYLDMTNIAAYTHVTFLLNFLQKRISIQLYSHDKELYNYLLNRKEEINKEFEDYELEWIENKSSYNIKTVKDIDISNRNNWEEAMNWHLETMEKYYEIFTTYLNEYE